MLKKILICVLMVLVVVGVVVSVVALRDNITKIETDTGDKPDDTEQSGEDNDEDGLYTVTLSEKFSYYFCLKNTEEFLEPGATFDCEEFAVEAISSDGDFYWYVTASGERGWFLDNEVVKLTEDITILGGADLGFLGDIF